MGTKRFEIEGMHCANCAANIDEELADLVGVSESHTSFESGRTDVVVADEVTEAELIAAIATAGYTARPIDE